MTAFAYGAMMIPSVDESEIETAAMKVAEEGAALAGELGLVATAEIAEATYEGTWHAVVASADAHDAVLIAIGARGLSTFKSLFLGSVSHIINVQRATPISLDPLVYHLLSLTHNRRIRVEVTAPDADPHIPSVVATYPTADWHERETWDFFGIVFDGHPALTRIEMPDDWPGHPQRKDYPLGGIDVEYKGAVIHPPDIRRSYN